MIKDILTDICKISDDESLNIENYIDSINYIDNLYIILKTFQKFSKIKELKFLPSFKGKYVCEKINLPSYIEENELRYFIIQSDLFLGDVKYIIQDLNNLNENIHITIEENIMKIINR